MSENLTQRVLKAEDEKLVFVEFDQLEVYWKAWWVKENWLVRSLQFRLSCSLLLNSLGCRFYHKHQWTVIYRFSSPFSPLPYLSHKLLGGTEYCFQEQLIVGFGQNHTSLPDLHPHIFFWTLKVYNFNICSNKPVFAWGLLRSFFDPTHLLFLPTNLRIYLYFEG